MTEKMDEGGLPANHRSDGLQNEPQSNEITVGSSQGPSQRTSPEMPPPPPPQANQIRKFFEKLDPIIADTLHKIQRKPLLVSEAKEVSPANVSSASSLSRSSPASNGVQATLGDDSDKQPPPGNFLPPPPVPEAQAQAPVQGSSRTPFEKLSPLIDRTILDFEACTRVVAKFVSTQEIKVKEEILSRAPEPYKPQQPIEKYRPATPCPSTWESMSGTDKFRLCTQCKLNVYDFTGMEPSDVQALLFKRENKENPALYRRKDGRFLTSDCPVGVQRGRNTLMLIVGAILVVGALIAIICLTPPPPKPVVTESKPATSPANNKGPVATRKTQPGPAAAAKRNAAANNPYYNNTQQSMYTRSGPHVLKPGDPGYIPDYVPTKTYQLPQQAPPASLTGTAGTGVQTGMPAAESRAPSQNKEPQLPPSGSAINAAPLTQPSGDTAHVKTYP